MSINDGHMHVGCLILTMPEQQYSIISCSMFTRLTSYISIMYTTVCMLVISVYETHYRVVIYFSIQSSR